MRRMMIVADIVELFINGFFTGIAVALGTFLANRVGTSRLDKAIGRMEKKVAEMIKVVRNESVQV
jgi:hypothetical protein